MKLIDIDRLKPIESHIHYIKIYKGSAILMDMQHRIHRFNVEFTIEYKPIGNPEIQIKFIDHPHFPIINIVKKMKTKILDLDTKGILEEVYKNEAFEEK